jgi:hypothetical protein
VRASASTDNKLRKQDKGERDTLIGAMIVALLLAAVPASAGTRVALVIGNSAYQNAPFLPNPANDGADLSASLGRLGFDVKTLTSARYDDMRRALIDFDQKARGAELALIFFSGQGFQIGGENWLIPVDASWPLSRRRQ